jgi:hypothetical protein
MAEKPRVRLVHQGGGLQGVVRAFFAKLQFGDSLEGTSLTAGIANAVSNSTTMHSAPARKSLSPLEQFFMDYVWARTILKNLEKKGYITHEVRGRTFFIARSTPNATSPPKPPASSSTASAAAPFGNCSSVWWTTR